MRLVQAAWRDNISGSKWHTYSKHTHTHTHHLTRRGLAQSVRDCDMTWSTSLLALMLCRFDVVMFLHETNPQTTPKPPFIKPNLNSHTHTRSLCVSLASCYCCCNVPRASDVQTENPPRNSLVSESFVYVFHLKVLPQSSVHTNTRCCLKFICI